MSCLQGKRAAMVTFSAYPYDPRPRRAVEALVEEGMTVDLICVGDETASQREASERLTVTRIPISNRRGGKVSYAYQYAAFILVSSAILAARSIKRRYDLVHVHNMPDVLVVSALAPRIMGAKVLLDLHDPMPELMRTIFDLPEGSLSVRVMAQLEKWSIACANAVVTVNMACKRIFSERSCSPKKIGVVMNSPDEQLFALRIPRPHSAVNGIPAARFVIMYHGSLVERNGLDLAVAALAQVRKTMPSVELRIIGLKTAFLGRVMAQVRERGLEECVRYLGPRLLEDLVGEIDECDVGVIPNLRNAFTDINTPTRIFEYLARGKPVIAPLTPGIQDYFDPESLVFFESGDAESLSQKLLFVAAHPEEAAKITARGQQVYSAHKWCQERQTLVNLVKGLLDMSKAR